jgi:beta-1,4-glucosyltransferase
MVDPFPTREILGVKVAVCRREEAIRFLLERLERRAVTAVAFANANLVGLLDARPDGAKLLAGFLVLNDGVGLDLASKILHGAAFPDNLNGTDFTPTFLSVVPKGTRIFLFGAKPGVAQQAGAVLAARFGVTIAGERDGYGDASDPMLIKAICAARADIALVALGNPRQEEWIAAHARELGAPIVMGVGALFDFVAGVVPRAPQIVQRARLEWLWRAVHEPRRLARRYSIDLASFLLRVRRQMLAERASKP